MPPIVSILIPAYNAEKWIAETLRSALEQDYPAKEVIIVNDGSKDGTTEIVKSMRSPEVKLVDQPSQGGPAARNTALQHARGDYIQWLDHDDLLAPDKISAHVRAAEETANPQVLFTGP